ncbi:LuxR C-terminal-related transcriptional regulator [Providencia rettgeri]|uniref:helix-turn-helix transcriptional regulator n=1 Tax=Providencia TaxID=586 RepID=UPI0018C4B2AE|nr:MULTISPECIES: LuxR C-terminal-related transcriptional regulator [Providencia]MBG5923130.1 helix-turn-helix transcriptional regulator [Providencia rettgeri]MBS0918162.1 helix-turn-helix transcriptional regulator [Providencia rettgeri]MCX9095692.1 LuxR C-terminal-related transcriptional regulator [Providencia rettgeri]MCX9124396.1 LuxR C-terminal-related transcriptional regulator [Providencia rettgeri]MCX9129560.1 LuxR C-terminal-related transcriptional regulator [Providencia rettgeri]
MENYLEKLPDVIDSVATNQFYPNLLSWLSSLIAFDNAIVYSFEKGAPPRFLSKVERRNSDSINRIYQRGAYLMDPFYQEIQKGGACKVLTLKELAPKGFYHTDYYLNFYRKTGWCDEAGLLLDISTDRQLGIFFGNEDRPFFSGKYTQAPLKDAFDIIRSMVKLHKDVSPSSVSNHHQNTDMQTRFGLTPRECEVVELILAGKGSPQIAQMLFISLGTVKNHRKNIYQKLNINSQVELFNLLMNRLS